MAMLSVYADESGNDGNSPLLAVAGYVSDVETWADFQKEWNEFLIEEEIPLFHSSDMPDVPGTTKAKLVKVCISRFDFVYCYTIVTKGLLTVCTDDHAFFTFNLTAKSDNQSHTFPLFGPPWFRMWIARWRPMPRIMQHKPSKSATKKQTNRIGQSAF